MAPFVCFVVFVVDRASRFFAASQVLRFPVLSSRVSRSLAKVGLERQMVRNTWIPALCTAVVTGISVLVAAGSGPAVVADAAQAGDREAVKTLLRQAADVNGAQGDGMTALHWAAQKNDVELVRMLLYAGANVKATTRINGYTPLLLAARAGNAPVLEPLLESGADAN